LLLRLLLVPLGPLMGFKPLPLRLPLRLPRLRLLPASLGGLRLPWTPIQGTHVAIGVAATAYDAIPDVPFCHLDLLPILRTVPKLLLLGDM